jgi:mannose/fructose/N-acetylgalactosamine-specific phosphotransferase system component IID
MGFVLPSLGLLGCGFAASISISGKRLGVVLLVLIYSVFALSVRKASGPHGWLV